MNLQIEYKPGEITVRTSEATGIYSTIEDALAGVRIILETAEELVLYPLDRFPSQSHRDLEKIASAVERQTSEWQVVRRFSPQAD
jgi:hypothetical protein